MFTKTPTLGAAMSELLGVADTKSKHAGAMQEIEDKAHTKEVKADAMQELLKVQNIFIFFQFFFSIL